MVLFLCLFVQVQMTPWNCIPSDLDAGNILSCHVLFISFMSSILFVVRIQLFFDDEVATISSSSFSLASLFSPLLPGCLGAKILPWLSLIQFFFIFLFLVFIFLALFASVFQCWLRPGLFGPCYWKGIRHNKQRPIRWLNALLYVAKYVIRPVYWLSKKRQDSSNLQSRVTAHP